MMQRDKPHNGLFLMYCEDLQNMPPIRVISGFLSIIRLIRVIRGRKNLICLSLLKYEYRSLLFFGLSRRRAAAQGRCPALLSAPYPAVLRMSVVSYLLIRLIREIRVRYLLPFGFLRSVGAQASKLGVRRNPVCRDSSNVKSVFAKTTPAARAAWRRCANGRAAARGRSTVRRC